MSTLKLCKELDLDGNKVKELNYDFTLMTGKDLKESFKNAIKSGYVVSGSYELDPVIASYIFAEAAHVDYTDVKRLNFKDYTLMAKKVREFLLAIEADLDDEVLNQNQIYLEKPILVNGEDVKEIKFDFDEMTGTNTENAFKNATKSGYIVSSSYELDPIIGVYMFAEAAKMNYSDLERMSLKDYIKAGTCAKYFFIQSLNGDQEEEN